jgi:hypothetical protein
MDRNDMLELSLGFAGLAERVAGHEDGGSALQRMVELAVKSVEGCRYATITQVRSKSSHLLATSDPVGSQLDRLQTELGEGPCLDAVSRDENFVITDLIHETRWPRFASLAARATDVRSVLVFRLAGSPPHVLAIYGDGAGGLGDEALDTATIFASHASTLVALVAAEEHSANLETALESSREIGIALGILMAHRKITQQAAFDLLRAASQNLHRKLRDIAGEVMETGALPDFPARAGGAGVPRAVPGAHLAMPAQLGLSESAGSPARSA